MADAWYCPCCTVSHSCKQFVQGKLLEQFAAYDGKNSTFCQDLKPPFILIFAVTENTVVSSVFACDAFDSGVHNLVHYYCAGSCQLNCKV